ncbi:MAG TPA: 2-dehydropantoate 2-reductase [Thermoplasmata archaeon]|nr:2-dehydropantoate 2-reductase [Thermoplasmata archaeon]
MKILILAAGAVGSILAARLEESGHEVEVVARADHAAAIRASGLRIDGVGAGTFRLPALDGLAGATEPDLVIVTAKTFDLPNAARDLGRRFPQLPPTLLPQNGLHIEGPIRDLLRSIGVGEPERSLVRAVTFLGATLERPGVVRQVGNGELVFQDPAAGGPAASATREFVRVFRGTTLRVRTVPDLERELWRKAIVNAAINPLTALHGVPNGRLRDPPYRDPARRLLREAQQAASLAGYAFSDAESDAELDRVLRGTAENRSSMLQDWDRGRPTEVDAISGEILREAESHGVELPETRAVVQRLRAGHPPPAGGTQPS